MLIAKKRTVGQIVREIVQHQWEIDRLLEELSPDIVSREIERLYNEDVKKQHAQIPN